MNPGSVGAVSPAIDSGDPSITLIAPQYFPPDTFNLDGIDGTSEPTPDLNLAPAKRVIASQSMDAIINRGAYEDLCTPAPGCFGDLVTSSTFQPPGDGYISGADLSILLGEWCNPSAPNCCLGCISDLVTSATFQPPPDGIVDGADLAVLLGAWGNCPCGEETESTLMFGGGESESSEEESAPSYDNPFYGTYLGLLLDELTATSDNDTAAEALAELLDLMSE